MVGAAQTGTNVTTAQANAHLGNIDQYGPDGSVTYTTDPNQTQSFTDPSNGATYTIPKYIQNTNLSASQQAIKDQQDAAKLGLSTLANNQTKFLQDYMAKPFDGSNEATEARLMELGRKRLDPMLADRRAALETKLANQGYSLGSKGYDAAMLADSQSENDAYNSLMLQGRGQAFAEGQAIRNQPINEITGLMSGSQIAGTPQFGANTNPQSMPTVDMAGIYSNYDNQRMQIAQQKNAATSGILGGLFGLGSAFIRSDRKVKTNIKRIGTADNGLPIYSYNYAWGGPSQIGFMADEVEAVMPQAVKEFGGVKHVDYSLATGAA